MLSYLFELLLVLTTSLDGWLAGWVALEEWKLRLTSAKVELKLRLSLAINNVAMLQCSKVAKLQSCKENFFDLLHLDICKFDLS